MKSTKSSNYKPLISIITTSTNSEKHIEQTIQSVLSQSYTNIEYIIMDGGSSDGTLDIIQKYSDKIKYCVSEADQGVYDAINKGILHSSGDLVGIIHSDDWYDQNTLNWVVEAYQQNQDAGVFFSDMISVTESNGKELKIKFLGKMKLKRYMSVNHPTCFIKRELYDKYKYDLSYRIAADYDLMLKLYFNGVKFHYINSVLAYHRHGGISSNYKSVLEAYKVKQKYIGRIKAFFWFLNDTRSYFNLFLKRLLII